MNDNTKVAEMSKAIQEWQPNLDALDAFLDGLGELVARHCPDATPDQIQRALEISPIKQWLRLDQIADRVEQILCECDSLNKRAHIMTSIERREGVWRLLGLIASIEGEMGVVDRLAPEEATSFRSYLDRGVSLCLSAIAQLTVSIAAIEDEDT